MVCSPGCRAAPPSASGQELERHRVHAITQSGRLGPVIKNVADMSIAAAACNCGAQDAKAEITLLDHVVLRYRLPEAGPAGTGFVLGFRIEQYRGAADATVEPVGVVIPERSGECRFSARVARHIKGNWGQ